MSLITGSPRGAYLALHGVNTMLCVDPRSSASSHLASCRPRSRARKESSPMDGFMEVNEDHPHERKPRLFRGRRSRERMTITGVGQRLLAGRAGEQLVVEKGLWSLEDPSRRARLCVVAPKGPKATEPKKAKSWEVRREERALKAIQLPLCRAHNFQAHFN